MSYIKQNLICLQLCTKWQFPNYVSALSENDQTSITYLINSSNSVWKSCVSILSTKAENLEDSSNGWKTEFISAAFELRMQRTRRNTAKYFVWYSNDPVSIPLWLVSIINNHFLQHFISFFQRSSWCKR